MKPPNVAASVRPRLLTLAQSKGWEFNRVLARYGVERVICRLAASPHGERFLLKGAMLFTVWEGSPHRATRDLDLLGLRRGSLEELVALFDVPSRLPCPRQPRHYPRLSGASGIFSRRCWGRSSPGLQHPANGSAAGMDSVSNSWWVNRPGPRANVRSARQSAGRRWRRVKTSDSLNNYRRCVNGCINVMRPYLEGVLE